MPKESQDYSIKVQFEKFGPLNNHNDEQTSVEPKNISFPPKPKNFEPLSVITRGDDSAHMELKDIPNERELLQKPENLSKPLPTTSDICSSNTDSLRNTTNMMSK